MKTLHFNIKLLLLVAFLAAGATRSAGQVNCTCIDWKFTPKATNPCCFELSACISNLPACFPVTQVTVVPLSGALIVSAAGASTFTSSLSGGQAVFNSATSMNGLCPTYQAIGEVCFLPSSSPSHAFQLNFGNSGNASICKFTAIVNNACLLPPCQITSKSINCGLKAGEYLFSYFINNVAAGCSVTMTDLASGGSVGPLAVVPSGTGVTVSGTLLNPVPFSNPANYQVQVFCNGQVTCNLMLQYTLPCCINLGPQNIRCDPNDPTKYLFQFQVQNTVLPCGASAVSMIDLATSLPVTPLNVVVSGSNQLTVSGSLPTSLVPSGTYQVVLNCPGTPVCTLLVTYNFPCCFKISVADKTVCTNSPLEHMQIVGCAALPCVQQVRWYVNTWPCPGTPIGAVPFQVTGSCADLVLLPPFLNSPGMYCVWAEVDYLCFCSTFTTVVSMMPTKLTICDPPTVSISPLPQEFCSTSVTPAQLTATAVTSAACPANYQWFLNNAQIGGATSANYTPTGLSYGGAGAATDGCRSIYTFRVDAKTTCGTASATTTITIYNDAASAGTLTLCPNVPLPLCCDDAVKVCYAPGCIYPKPEKWTWFFKNITTNPAWSVLPGAGDMNPLWLTNKICEDHWFRVESKNGACPAKNVDLFLPVKGELQQPVFTAAYDDPCKPTSVNMTVSFSPCASGSCNYTICWFFKGILVGTTTATSSPASFTYPFGLPGNYYAVVKDDDCPREVEKSNVVNLPKIWKAVAACPCFICGTNPATMQGFVVDLPTGGFCTNFQWYELTLVGSVWVETPLATTPTSSPLGATATTNHVGTYIFEATCDGCTKRDTCATTLLCTMVSTSELADEHGLSLQPNPTSGEVDLIFKKALASGGSLFLIDAAGRLVQKAELEKGVEKAQLDLRGSAPGIYFLEIRLPDGRTMTAKIIRQND